MKRKVVLIGIDGATWNLIKPWMEEGKLPGFKKLVETGVYGDLESTKPPISPSAWTSIFTGTNPGKHNIFGFVKRKKDSYFVTPISSYDRKAQPLWKLISDNGGRCIALNIPFAYPPDKINGIMTSGLGTPSKDSEFAYPASFKKILNKQFPKYDVDFNEDLILLGIEKYPVSHIQTITDEQIKLAKHLLKTEPWDLFSIVFRSMDVIQHFYWQDKKVVLSCYQQLDKFLKLVLDHLKSNSLLIVCSDHGFESIHTKIYINNWLQSQNLLEIANPPSKGIKKVMPSAETVQGLLLKLGCKNLVWKLKRSKYLENIIRKVVRSDKGQYIFNIDWLKTKAYFLEGSEALININLRHREPEGKVDRNEWVKERQNVIRLLLKLKDPKSGKKIIDHAYTGDEIYNGDPKKFPDIIVIPKKGYRLVGGYNNTGNILDHEQNRAGEHSKYGIFIGLGDQIQNDIELKDIKVYDIAPMILDFLRIPPPPEFDGKVPQYIFKK